MLEGYLHILCMHVKQISTSCVTLSIKVNIRKELRKTIRDKRLSLTPQVQLTSAQQLCTTLSTHSKIETAQHIALYLANDGELNTTPLIEWCWSQNKTVYLPVIHPFSKGHLLFLKYDENTLMVQNRFGIYEPKLNINLIRSIKDIDVVFTPLVAFDTSGTRLGMGGGFYDRTLQTWYEHYKKNKLVKPYPIGLAHDCQQVNYIPVENWDIPIPEIITPTQHFIF